MDAARSSGLLKTRIDYDQSSRELSRTALGTPQGDTAAIQALLDFADAVDRNNIDYDVSPDAFSGPGENSNSFVTTAITEAGLTLPEGTDYIDLVPKREYGPGYYAPGLGRVFDLGEYKKLPQDLQLELFYIYTRVVQGDDDPGPDGVKLTISFLTLSFIEFKKVDFGKA